jgi:DNA-binding NarL/FixJ family response regulator
MRGLICDDHPLMREALGAAMRERWPDVSLTACGDFPSAWAAAAAQPDFCLVDLSMPGAEPIAGLAGVRARAPEAVILVVTGLEDDGLFDEIGALGVAGIYSKNAEPRLLMDAIRDSVPGLQALEAKRLPPRQAQVLELLSKGQTNKEIARSLGISPATVKIHMARLTSWLGAVNRTDAVARARKARLV